jgi:hypothetical protein
LQKVGERVGIGHGSLVQGQDAVSEEAHVSDFLGDRSDLVAVLLCSVVGMIIIPLVDGLYPVWWWPLVWFPTALLLGSVAVYYGIRFLQRVRQPIKN